MLKFINRPVGAVATAALFGAFLSTMTPYGAQAQQAAASATATPPAPHKAAGTKHTVEGSEKRIKELHDQLRISTAQEKLWGDVAQSMRDNGQAMRASMTDRSTRLKTMSAVDDLKSYQLLADQHSDGLKRLIPAFEALYASMTPDQQKHADRVFGKHEHHAHG